VASGPVLHWPSLGVGFWWEHSDKRWSGNGHHAAKAKTSTSGWSHYSCCGKILECKCNGSALLEGLHNALTIISMSQSSQFPCDGYVLPSFISKTPQKVAAAGLPLHQVWGNTSRTSAMVKVCTLPSFLAVTVSLVVLADNSRYRTGCVHKDVWWICYAEGLRTNSLVRGELLLSCTHFHSLTFSSFQRLFHISASAARARSTSSEHDVTRSREVIHENLCYVAFGMR